MTKTKLIGVDCGELKTGVVVLTENGIREGLNIANKDLVQFILKERSDYEGDFRVVVEDVRPYNMRITDGIIYTIKFLGQLEWRLSELEVKFTLIPRWQIKQWVFMQFRTLAEPDIVKKIEYSRKRKEMLKQRINPRKQTPTFIYVDDRIVQKAMRIWWKIPKPEKVGERAAYGLKDHSWQALALISYFLQSSAYSCIHSNA